MKLKKGMTNRELQRELAKYPDDLRVIVGYCSEHYGADDIIKVSLDNMKKKDIRGRPSSTGQYCRNKCQTSTKMIVLSHD